MGFDPYNGDCVVFIKRDRTQLRALMGDERGLILIARRFEGGRLDVGWALEAAPASDCCQQKSETISFAQLTMLLEGATCVVQKRVPRWKKTLQKAAVTG